MRGRPSAAQRHRTHTFKESRDALNLHCWWCYNIPTSLHPWYWQNQTLVPAQGTLNYRVSHYVWNQFAVMLEKQVLTLGR